MKLMAMMIPLCLGARMVHGSASEPVRVLVTYGGHGFKQAEFFAMFDAMNGITYEKAELPGQFDRLRPGLEKDVDVIVRYDMAPGVSPEQRAAFQQLMDRGIGLVALHHNLGAHRNWPAYREIIGGKFIFAPETIGGVRYEKSPWKHGQKLRVRVADGAHPITKGLTDFEIEDESYGKFYVSPQAHILLTTDHPENNRQVAWTQPCGASRVFYLMLGHDPTAWKNPNYGRILLRAIRWAAARQ